MEQPRYHVDFTFRHPPGSGNTYTVHPHFHFPPAVNDEKLDKILAKLNAALPDDGATAAELAEIQRELAENKAKLQAAQTA